MAVKKIQSPDFPNNITFNISQKIKDLDKTRKETYHFFQSNGINEDIISTIELSLYEVLINIVEHAPKKFKKKDINIECNIRDDCIEIIIRNYGEEFDITTAKMPDIQKHYKSGKKDGLGLYIIRTLMDEVKYSYNDSINELILIKKMI